jgi:hypothetical protein
MADDPKTAEVRANFDVFQAKLPELLKTHAGKFAVLRHGEIVDFFDTMTDAARFGIRMFPDDMFSVQEVSERRIDLGFFSVAFNHATV